MNPILLTPLDISIAASLIILDAVLSIWLKLRLHRQIAIAAARMVVQLVAIGYVLRFIFALNNPAVTLLLILVMVLVAAREVAARPERRFKDQSNLVIGFVSVGFATFVTAILALTTAIRPQPWFDPHYAMAPSGANGKRSKRGCRSAKAIAKQSRRWCGKLSAAVCCRSSIKCRQPAS